MFILAISCLTTSYLPWFMDLKFQVPIQYCSLQHQTLLSPQDTFTTECYFLFGSVLSFLLELPLHSSPVAYWTPADLEGSSFSVISFCLFMLFMGFSRQECWSGLPFPSPVDHVLLELCTMTCPSWVAPHGMALFHSVTQSCDPCDQTFLTCGEWEEKLVEGNALAYANWSIRAQCQVQEVCRYFAVVMLLVY